MRNFLCVALICLTSHAFAKTRIAVSKFDNKAGSGRCFVNFWGSNDLGSGMSDQLVTELHNRHRYDIQERENLKRMYAEEHELINADPSSLPAKNKFKAAQYSITGAVTAFELCNDDVGGNVDVGGLLGFKGSGLKVGGGKSTAKVVLDLRVVDVETGSVLTSVRAEGNSTTIKADVNGNVKGAGFGSKAFFSSPIGEATRKALQDAVAQIEASVPNREDAPVTAAPAQQNTFNQKTMGSVAANRPPVHPVQRSTAQEGHIESKQVCAQQFYAGGRGNFVGCKVLRSTQAGRLQVMHLSDGKEAIQEKNEVFNLVPARNVHIGQTLVLNCEKVKGPTGCAIYRKAYLGCKVVDVAGTQGSLVCNEHDITADMTALFSLQPVSARKPASH